tara:strand:+ start:5304 stop:5570 length:267 start_codon:yes stop_codon:yes gene_type:complete
MNGPFIPIEELAKHFSVSVSTIRAWVRQRHIPKDTYIKVGNTYRFSIADVSAALTNNENVKETQAQVGGLEAVTDVTSVQGYTDDEDL